MLGSRLGEGLLLGLAVTMLFPVGSVHWPKCYLDKAGCNPVMTFRLEQFMLHTYASRCVPLLKRMVMFILMKTCKYIGPKLRQAHRYLTKSVHRNWRAFADLNSPKIRSRFLYTAYELYSQIYSC